MVRYRDAAATKCLVQPYRDFQFQKGSQRIIGTHNETAFCRAGSSSRVDYGRVEMSGTSELYRVAISRSHSTIATQVVSSLTRRRDQRPADRSPLFIAQLFRKQQRDASAEHCMRARDE